MKRQVLFASLFLTLLLCLDAAFVRGEDWRNFRGRNGESTAAGSGIFAEGGAYSLSVAWQHRIGSGYSSVSIVEGVAINLFSDPTSDFAGAFRTDTGEELWRFRLGDRYPGRWGSKDGPISTSLIDRGRVFLLDPAGHFYCLDFKTGERIWDADLPKTHAATEPFYGFATSPLLWKDTVILQVGGPAGSTVAAFDAASGNTLWKSGVEDAVNYQSPFLMNPGGRSLLITLGDRKMSGLDPDTGRIYWTIDYGDGSDIGSKTAQVVKISETRFFVNGTAEDSTMFELSPDDLTVAPKEVWKTRHIKNTYVVSVYHDGLIFGYNSRILACVDAGTGELVWRSREPGDGFPILVDGYLLIATKEGHLSIAPASREGYQEVANIAVFDDLVWSTPTFVDGRIYLRSIESWARLEVRPARTLEDLEEEATGRLSDSDFGRFVARVSAARDKQSLIEEFLAANQKFPIIEGGNTVHFIYYGDGEDISVSGDLFGDRYDRPINRIPETQMFYYSAHIESDARLLYGFTRDFDEFLGDPRNPDKDEPTGLAIVTMPAWQGPDFLTEAPEAWRGRIEELTLESRHFGETLPLKVYLPGGYDSAGSYPVLYVSSGTLAIEEGHFVRALDNLIGKKVEPLIAVFVPDMGERPGGKFDSRKSYQDYAGDSKDKYRLALVEELLPLIESRYPVDRRAERRALLGLADPAYASLYATLKHPDLFTGLGLLSITFEPGYRQQNTALLKTPAEQPLRIYLEWGKYDSRSPREGWDAVDDGRAFAETLRMKGYSFVGGETHEGAGWVARRNRIDRLLVTLFPAGD